MSMRLAEEHPMRRSGELGWHTTTMNTYGAVGDIVVFADIGNTAEDDVHISARSWWDTGAAGGNCSGCGAVSGNLQ